MRRKRQLSILLVLLFLVSCAGIVNQTQQSPQANVYKALVTSKTIYDTALKSMATMDAIGKLPPDVKAKAIQLGNTYMNIHNSVVQALLDGKTPDLTLLNKALDNFLITVAPYYKP